MASRNGSAAAAPAPRSSVPSRQLFTGNNSHFDFSSAGFYLSDCQSRLLRFLRMLHLKRQAVHDAQHQLRKTIIVRREPRFDGLQRGRSKRSIPRPSA